MRILIYSYNYYPEPIGIAPLMTELAEGLVKRGHQVRVVTAMPWYPEGEIYPEYQGKLYLTEERNGVTIQRSYIWTRRERNLKNRALFELSFIGLSFLQALKGWKPDLIFLTIPGLPVAIPATFLSWLYRIPIVLNLQDILPDAAVHVGLITNQKLIKVLGAIEKFAYKNATKISVIADGFTKNITQKGVPPEKIIEIPNWVDINFIKPLPENNNYFRQEYGLENKFIVLYAGNIALTQGLETAINAAKILENIPDIVIVIVGEQKALLRLEKYCQERQVNNVKLIPFQPREKLPQMLATADVGLVIQKSNVISFNMPSKIQLLLASGKPIIASVPANGTAASAIINSESGFIVKPENPLSLAQAIQDLYNNRDKIIDFGRNGRNYAEKNYCFEITLNKYEKIFNQLIDSHAR
jgi:colanic acid biosynthesis glycosyl transferase WcaI